MTPKKSNEDRLKEHLEQLRAYKKKHGHINAKAKEGPLGKWLNRKRQQYKEGKLDNDLKTYLEELGIRWSHSHAKMEELKEYIEQHGHSNVPKCEEYASLARWTTQQRESYRAGTISEERIAELEELGFDWSFTEDKSKKDAPIIKSHSERLQEHMEQLRAIREAKAAIAKK